MFEKSSFVSTVKDSCVRYNQFVFGKNIKKVKNVKIEGVNVNISLHLFHDITDKDFEDAVSNVIKLVKQKGYAIKKENNDKKKKTSKNIKPKSKKIKTRKINKKSIFGIKLW
jgi:hypothetical protein